MSGRRLDAGSMVGGSQGAASVRVRRDRHLDELGDVGGSAGKDLRNRMLVLMRGTEKRSWRRARGALVKVRALCVDATGG
jgi:hypothetical protein